MKNQILYAGLIVIYLFLLAGCNKSSGEKDEEMSKYESAVILGTPTTAEANVVKRRTTTIGEGLNHFIASRNISLDGVIIFVNKVFNLEAEEGNLVGEAKQMDSTIDELNKAISENPGTPVSGGAVTLPFFNETVPMGHALLLNTGSPDDALDNTKIGYNKTDTSESITTFSVSQLMGVQRNYNLVYGIKENGTINIYNAWIYYKEDTHSIFVNCVFKLYIEGENYFTFRQGSPVYSYASAGQSKGYFLFRVWESGGGAGKDMVVLYSYNSGAYDIAASLPLTSGATIAITDMAKPAEVTDEMWKKMVDHINTIVDPGSAGVAPDSLATFTGDYLGL